jgi:hypothetical protein
MAAHVSPSSVSRVYFMSRYAFVAGDITSLAPWRSAASEVSARHICATVPGRRRALPISSHPTMRLPWRSTMPCTRSTKCAYCSCVSTSTSSPPMWMNGPGVIAASSRTTSSTNLYTTSLSWQSALHPTRVPVYSPGLGALGDGCGIGRLQPSSGYAAIAACVCAGTSISGTTVMKRSCA